MIRMLLGTLLILACHTSMGLAEKLVSLQQDLSGVVRLAGDGEMTPQQLSRVIVFIWDVEQEALWRQVTVFRAENPFPQAAVGSDGRFLLPELDPDTHYTVEVGRLPRGWSLESVRLGGQDVLAVPFQVQNSSTPMEMIVSLTSDVPSTLTGVTLTDDSPGPAWVVIFPADRRQWVAPWRNVFVVRSGPDGAYRKTGISSGDYLVAGLPIAGSKAPSVKDPSRLAPLVPRAVSVVIQRSTNHELTVPVSSRTDVPSR